MDQHPELPPELRRLAWLDMDSDSGREYWAAMNLMGDYAAANHAVIHQKIAKALKAKVLAGVENHHNFAWLEEHNGKQVYVHRKGATPPARACSASSRLDGQPRLRRPRQGQRPVPGIRQPRRRRLMSRTQARNTFR